MDPVQEFLLMKRGALKKCSGCGKMAEVGADGKCAGCGGARPKVGAVMSTEKRESLPGKQFAIPTAKAKKIGVAGEIQGESKGKYPINDERHARNALSRVSTFGTPAERAAVRSKVYAKYPQLRAAFESSHGGESPTSKENLKKPTQGSIGKTGAVSETDAAKIKLVSGAMQQTKGMTVPQRKKVMKEVGKQIPNQSKTSSLRDMISSFAKEMVEIEKAAKANIFQQTTGDMTPEELELYKRYVRTGGAVGGALQGLPMALQDPVSGVIGTGLGAAGGYLGGMSHSSEFANENPITGKVILPGILGGPLGIGGDVVGEHMARQEIARRRAEAASAPKTASLRHYVQKLAYGDRY